MGETSAHIQTLDLQDGLFATRPDDGDQGISRNIPLWANYFEMVLQKPGLVLYRYDMSFSVFPPKTSKSLETNIKVPEGKKLAQVIRCALKTSTFNNIKSEIATDFSKILLSCKRLNNNQTETGQFKFWAENEVENGVPRPQKNAIRFQMKLEENGQLHVSELLTFLKSRTKRNDAYENILPIVQALDIVIGHYGKLSLEIATPKLGKCFPHEPNNTETFRIGDSQKLGYLRGIRGFFASIRATTDRALVNCNACCGAFHRPGPLLGLFSGFLDPRNPSLEQCKRLESAIQGLRVELTHLRDDNDQPMKSTRTVFGLAHPYRGPRHVEFEHKTDGRTYTVAAYWQEKRYPAIPNFAYPVVNVGDKNNPTYVPPHVCNIVSGQMAKKKLDATQVTDMLDGARRDPDATMKSINESAFGVLGLENNPTLDSFGLSLNHDMIRVRGRVLEQPKIVYQTVPLQVNIQGRWNVAGQEVVKAGRLEKWSIIKIARDEKSLRRDKGGFEAAVRRLLNFLEITLGKDNVTDPAGPWPKEVVKGDETALRQVFDRCKSQGIRFLLVVLPDSDAGTYKQIKKIGDVDCGIITVCILEHFKKFKINLSPSYGANVALKINLKLGGTNHKSQKESPIYKTTMVIGIDVTHPSPGPTKRTAPSVAAMVASVDSELSQWLVDLRINTASQEMVDLLGPMLRTRLELWQSKHAMRLPENLLIYRDGVSETQYKAVLGEELEKLRDTCKLLYKGGKSPRITLIIVGKRHHTRFFRPMGNNITNPAFGTVVDTGVTEARNWDFFLQSHHALLGTARPAHYFVLLNEIFTTDFLGPKTNISDYLQKLTYDMCYLFGRSTGPVSIPPPVYYADLACERSRCYGDYDDNISDTSSMVGDDRGGRKPPGSRGAANLPFRGSAPGGQAADRPGPSNQKSNTPAPGKQVDVKKMSKKEVAIYWEERTGGGSSKAEGKKAEAKPKGMAEGKTEEKASKGKAGGKLGEEKPRGDVQSKAQGKRPESKAEGQQKPETKGEEEQRKEKAQVEIHKDLKDMMFYV